MDAIHRCPERAESVDVEHHKVQPLPLCEPDSVGSRTKRRLVSVNYDENASTAITF
jgi:hypothetical protein